MIEYSLDQINSVKANVDSPTFTGTPTAPTATAGTSTAQVATTAFVTAANNNLQSQINTKAPLSSPVFTGRVTGPTGSGSSGGFGFDNDTGMVSSGDGNLKFYTNNVYAGGPITATNNWDINITGNAGSVSKLSLTDSNNPVTGPDTTTQNTIGYVNSLSLLGQSDGALYSQAYSPSWQHQIYGDYRTGSILVRGKNNGTWTTWNKVWHSGNDGFGSGLDADLLDGHDSAYYASVASPALTGTPTAPTAVPGTNTTQLATTEFVATAATKKVDKDSDTGAALLPSGTSAQRPASGWGKLRFNTDLAKFEGHNGTAWGSLGGATGGGNDAVFYVNGQTVTADYTIPSGQNAMSAGPITIADGVTVSISDGSVWTVV
jgi:hypothetical protein